MESESEPKDVIVLEAINKGAKKFDKIKKITRIEGKEIDELLERLDKNGMIVVVEKKGLFGTKRNCSDRKRSTRITGKEIRTSEKLEPDGYNVERGRQTEITAIHGQK